MLHGASDQVVSELDSPSRKKQRNFHAQAVKLAWALGRNSTRSCWEILLLRPAEHPGDGECRTELLLDVNRKHRVKVNIDLLESLLLQLCS